MEVIHPRVAGIDVHKKIVWVAVRLPGEGPGERTVTAKRFKTFWRSLRQMAAWLAELGVMDAAMESTGVYWWPVYHPPLPGRHARGARGRLRLADAALVGSQYPGMTSPFWYCAGYADKRQLRPRQCRSERRP
jgi:hypothetical protein